MSDRERIKNFLELIINEIEENGMMRYDEMRNTILENAKELMKLIPVFDAGQKVYYVQWISIVNYKMRIEEGYYFGKGGTDSYGRIATHFVSLTRNPLEAHLIIHDGNLFATKEEAEKRMEELANAHKKETNGAKKS